MYDIKADQYFDDASILQSKSKVFPITMQLNPINIETKVYALTEYPVDSTVAAFKQHVYNGSTVVLDNLKKFIGIESLPSTSILTITWGTETATTIDFIVNASQYYNAGNRLANNKDFNISLTFDSTALPTIIKPRDDYEVTAPNVAAQQFFDVVNPNGIIDQTMLGKYLDLTTVPYNASLSIINDHFDLNTGIVTFGIVATTWYDENKQLVNTSTTYDIQLKLDPHFVETYLYGIDKVDYGLSLDDFLLQIGDGSQLDYNKLAKFVNLDTLVTNTEMQYQNAVVVGKTIVFDLIVNRFYETDGLENYGKKSFRITLEYKEQTIEQLLSDVDIWIYVAASLAVFTITSVIWYVIAQRIKYSKSLI